MVENKKIDSHRRKTKTKTKTKEEKEEENRNIKTMNQSSKTKFNTKFKTKGQPKYENKFLNDNGVPSTPVQPSTLVQQETSNDTNTSAQKNADAEEKHAARASQYGAYQHTRRKRKVNGKEETPSTGPTTTTLDTNVQEEVHDDHNDDSDILPGVFLANSRELLQAQPGVLTALPQNNYKPGIVINQQQQQQQQQKQNLQNYGLGDEESPMSDSEVMFATFSVVEDSKSKNKTPRYILFAMLFLLAVAGVVGIAVFLTQGQTRVSNNDSITGLSVRNGTISTTSPTQSPSMIQMLSPLSKHICPNEISWIHLLDYYCVNMFDYPTQHINSIQEVMPFCIQPYFDNVTHLLSSSTAFALASGPANNTTTSSSSANTPICSSTTLALLALAFRSMLIDDTTTTTATDGMGDSELFFHLANLYFSLDGPHGWTQQDGWLETKRSINEDNHAVVSIIHPCNWYGVDCEETTGGVSLQLLHNGLGGTIPTEIGLFTSLRSFKGASSYGTLPTELCNIPNLNVIKIIDADMGGTLPTQLGNCRNLRELQIKNTMVEGTIPSEIGLCNQLSSLMIEGPRLYGTVPTEILSVLPLRYLSLGGPLNGTLLPTTNTTITNPTFLFPSSLERINIEDTELTGEIPWDSLGALTNMKSFRWTDNTRIDSVLPSTVGLLTSLAELVVAGSRGVTGSLPTEIGALTGLQQLILQDTKLEGNLPTELAQCTALQAIDVSITLMEGTIRPELCPLLQSDLAFSFNDCGSHVICLSTENCE